MFKRYARYELTTAEKGSIEFIDTKTKKQLFMNPLEIVNQGLAELFSDDDKITIGNFAVVEDPSVVIASNKGSVAVYNYARTLFYPILSTAYVFCLMLMCLTDNVSISLFHHSFPLSSFLFLPLVFTFEDCVSELFGFKMSLKMISQGFCVILITGIVLRIIFPLLENSTVNSDFIKTLGFLPKDLMMASVSFFFISFLDLFFFRVCLIKFRNLHFWFRSLVSSVISQFINAVLYSIVSIYVLSLVTPSSDFFIAALYAFMAGMIVSIAYLVVSYSIISFIKKKAM